jgi:hypothetical protein
MKELLHLIKDNIVEFSIFAFLWLGPIHGLIVFILIAIGVDTLMGRKAAKTIAIRDGADVRLAVTSKKTRHGFVSKVATYIGILILTLFLDKVLLNDLLIYFFSTFPIQFVITKGLGVILLLIELDSIDEKNYIITGKSFKQIIRAKVKKIKELIFSAKKFKDEIKE